MKKIVSLFLAAMMVLSLAACSGNSGSAPAETTAAAETEAVTEAAADTAAESEPGTPPDGGNGQPGTPPGGGSSSSDIDYAGAVEITSSETQTGQSYSSTTADESALYISTSDAVTITNATVKLIRFHRRDDPLMSAAKVVSLTAAMVSMLSLETALIARYGDGDMRFHTIMTNVVGGVVCLTELNIAIYMIRRGNRMIRQITEASD